MVCGAGMTRIKTPLILPSAPDLAFETSLWNDHILYVAGLDEAGRGAWAGPVAAGAVILPDRVEIASQLQGVNDSKKLTPSERDKYAILIKKFCLGWGVGMASAAEIDQMGIVPATRLAMKRALAELCVIPQHLLLDFITLPDNPLPQTPLVKGDARSLSIAAASILAKTSRDAFMVEQDRLYPGYSLAQHKGYGTSLHQMALKTLGSCEIHRKSFQPIRCLLQPVE
jgi:ribonuclease HII